MTLHMLTFSSFFLLFLFSSHTLARRIGLATKSRSGPQTAGTHTQAAGLGHRCRTTFHYNRSTTRAHKVVPRTHGPAREPTRPGGARTLAPHYAHPTAAACRKSARPRIDRERLGHTIRGHLQRRQHTSARLTCHTTERPPLEHLAPIWSHDILISKRPLLLTPRGIPLLRN